MHREVFTIQLSTLLSADPPKNYQLIASTQL